MTVVHHINPLNNQRSAVTHTDVSIYVYPDGSMDIDTDVGMFRLNGTVNAKQVAEFHKLAFNADEVSV